MKLFTNTRAIISIKHLMKIFSEVFFLQMRFRTTRLLQIYHKMSLKSFENTEIIYQPCEPIL